ncbi:hypothetical protein ACQ4WX_10410 [Streptomyces lasalocidi]
MENAGAAERLAHRIELEQWSEDFESIRTERDALRESLTRHKAELEEAQRRAHEAELRCASLERQLETAETRAEEDEAQAEAASAVSPRTLHTPTPTTQATVGDSVSFHLGFDAALGARLWRALDEQAPVPLAEKELQKSAVAPERLVIRYLKEEQGAQLPWNLNGFGNNDAGRQRDRSELNPRHFDMVHPIDLDWALLNDGMHRTWSPKDFADFIKSGLPYSFRHKLEPEYLEAAPLVVPEGPLSADGAFRLLARGLGDAWQISALKGHVLLYKEHTQYPNAVRYYRGESVQNA